MYLTGFRVIVAFLIFAGASYGVWAAMPYVDEAWLSKLVFGLLPFLGLLGFSIMVRSKLGGILKDEALTPSEGRRLEYIVRVRRRRLRTFNWFSLLATFLFIALPVFGRIPEIGDYLVSLIFGFAAFVFYLFLLVYDSLSEIESFQDKLNARVRLQKESSRLLEKLQE